MNIQREYDNKRRDFRGAVLRDARLCDARLCDADLSGADLSGADLSGADLSGAYLRGADLRGADLRGADLSGADLRGADLSGANLCDANLRYADLSGADLRGADLRGADLRGADLSGADLSNTICDPNVELPSFNASAFEIDSDGEHFFAYRTERSIYMHDNIYEIGHVYTAPIFSVDSNTSCHPGLYFGTHKYIRNAFPNSRIVKVRIALKDALQCGDKFRCRQFEVVEKA